MKTIKSLLWFAALMALCGTASAEPVSTAFAAVSAWASAASIPTILSAVGSAVSIVGALSGGQKQADNYNAAAYSQNEQAQIAAQSSDNTAAQLDQQAGQQRAAGQRRAQEQRRQAAIAESNVRARVGGGSTDASILGLTGNIAGEGEYNALTNMYEAEESALGQEAQAGTARSQSKLYRMQGDAALQRGAASADAAVSASRFNAASTIFSAGSTLFSKYGGGGVGNSEYNAIGRLERDR